MQQADYEAAIRGYQELAARVPRVAEFQANLGLAYYSAGRYADAARAYREALKLRPGLARARYFLGLSLAASGGCREALAYLEKDYPAVADRELKRNLGMDAVHCASATRQHDKAVDFLRRLNRDFPDDPDVLYITTHVYSELSTRASERLLFSAPESYQAHRLNAEVLEMQGRREPAGAEYRRVLELNPRMPGIHYRLGRLLLAGSRSPETVEAARREFEEELKADPSSSVAEYELGEMARRAGRWDEAIGHFARAVKLDAAFVEAMIGLGKSLTSARRAAEAVEPLESAVRLEPENAVAHYQLSFAYRRLGREPEAERELKTYRELHRKSVETMGNIRVGMLGLAGEPQTDEPPE